MLHEYISSSARLFDRRLRHQTKRVHLASMTRQVSLTAFAEHISDNEVLLALAFGDEYWL